MNAADKKLTPHACKVIKEFDEAAQAWGWTRDQGSGGAVARDEADYEKAKQSLETYILNLQKKANSK